MANGDGELEVMLKPANNLEDEVGPVDAGFGGADAGPAERQQQENILAGGVSKGLAAAGVLAGILSQLKSVSGILSGLASIASRALLPAVEVISELLRPVAGFVNDFIADPSGAVSEATGLNINPRQNPALRATGITSAAELVQGNPRAAAEELFSGSVLGQAAGITGEFIEGLFGDKTADQSSEAQKQQLKELANDPLLEKLGSLQG